MSSAGDVNGDGFDDLIIGATGADQAGGNNHGESYVLFGQSGGFASSIALSSLDGTTGFVLTGIDADDRSGRPVSSAGDVNGDGFDDLIIGAYRADQSGGIDHGETYVLFGRSGGFASSIALSSLDGTTGFVLTGLDPDDRSGRSVSSAGDVNGDGFDDLIIGAIFADQAGGNDHGESYIIFGGNFTGGAETQVGGDGSQTLSATLGAGVDILIGGRGNDTLLSDGGPDVLRGGEGDDTLAINDVDFSSTRRLVGGTGTDTLRVDTVGLFLNLPAIADNRITGIEVIDLSTVGFTTLVLDAQEVLNISDESNTLTIFENGDNIFIGTGWTQQPNQTVHGVVYEIFTQGAATLRITETLIVNLPVGNGGDDVTIRQNAGFVEVFDNNAMTVLDSVAAVSASSIAVIGSAGETNRLVVDYDFGGYFVMPDGIAFVGAAGGTDTLEIIGTGSTLATLTPAAGTLAAGTLTTQQGGSQTVIRFSEIEPLTATGLLTFGIDGALDIGGETLSVESTSFVQTGPVTILGGGTIDLSGGGLALGIGELLTGTGLINGRLFAAGGSTISATGSLTIGEATALDGFFSDGVLQTNTHTVTLLDANEAVLGSLTVLSTVGMDIGTLTAANGFLLEEGKNVTGEGTINGEFHNDGDVSGSGTGIIFNDLVTGIGTATNVTFNGGVSPGHSPAEIFLGGTVNLGASNTLFIELGGLTPGGQFDRLSSTGTINVDGALDVVLIDGFVPANGDSFEIIGAAAVNGTFDPMNINLPVLPLGLEWDVVYAAEAVTLSVFALATAITDTALNAPVPNPNRSGIAALDVTFDLPVNVAGAGSLTLFNHTTGQPVDASGATLVNNGTPIVSWDFSSLPLPDGRYTAEVATDQVTTTVGGPLASTFAFEFHVMRGDVSGDARVNATDFVVVDANFDPFPGAPFRAGDANGDGLVNASDFVAVDANFNPILLPLLELDFGDAPEASTSFPTTLAQDGARHVITGNTLFLGADRDAETDGQPDATASGDGADEDGVVLTGDLIIGTNVAVTVTSSDVGFVNGWVDFNQDGDWDDPGEQVLGDVPVVAGPNNLQITVPAGATLGSTFARFRLTAAAGYSYDGLAPSGEVEDYQLTVAAPPPDLPANGVEEHVTTSADPENPAERPANAIRRRLFTVLFVSFTTFEHPLSVFTNEDSSRRGI